MCGLIGAVTNTTFNYKEEGIIQSLFLVNALRGVHGCGLFSLWEEKNKAGKNKRYYNTLHSEEPSSAFVFSQEFSSWLNKNNKKVILGHSRHATIGDVKMENCHPFVSKDKQVIGFHNGTCRGQFDGRNDFETDSEAIVNLFADRGLKDTLDHLYDSTYVESNVAYAFQYYDRNDGKVRIIRNKERPLHFAYYSDCCFWASEEVFLAFALVRAGADPSKIKFRELKPGELVTIDPWASGIDNIVKFEEDFFSPPKKTYTSYGNSRNYMRETYTGESWWDQNDYNYGQSKPIRYFNVGPKQISMGRLENILNGGCGVCGNVWDISDMLKASALVTSQDEVICSFCKQQAKDDYGISPSQLHAVKEVNVN